MLSKRLQINCSAKNPIIDARVRFQAKRSVVLKENLSKFIAISTSEIKDVQVFIVELDQLHRKEVDKYFNKKTNDDESVVEPDNIFINE